MRVFTISRKEGQVLSPENPHCLWSSWRKHPRGYGREVRGERGEPGKAGARKPQGAGHLEEEGVDGQLCYGQNVTDNEDQGDCGEGPGSGQWMVLNHLGDSSFGGKWQRLAVVLGSEAAERPSEGKPFQEA